MVESKWFCIAEHYVCIRFCDTERNTMALLPSFATFATEAPAHGGPLLTLTVDDTLRPAKDRRLVRKFDTGNGDTLVYQLPDGGYQYIIRDIADRDCCLLICNKQFSDCRCALNGDWTMRSFGLNDALMLAYAFAGAFHDTLLIHASCIMTSTAAAGGLPVAYPFTAKSGTGKSTHTSLWMKHIEDCELLNDDNPIVRIATDGTPYIYGSPWSGKTPCYRNVSAPLQALVMLSQAKHNAITRQKGIQAYASIMGSVSGKRWDQQVAEGQHETENLLAQLVPVWHLECLPDEAAARLCCKHCSDEE